MNREIGIERVRVVPSAVMSESTTVAAWLPLSSAAIFAPSIVRGAIDGGDDFPVLGDHCSQSTLTACSDQFAPQDGAVPPISSDTTICWVSAEGLELSSTSNWEAVAVSSGTCFVRVTGSVTCRPEASSVITMFPWAVPAARVVPSAITETLPTPLPEVGLIESHGTDALARQRARPPWIAIA